MSLHFQNFPEKLNTNDQIHISTWRNMCNLFIYFVIMNIQKYEHQQLERCKQLSKNTLHIYKKTMSTF